MGRRIHYLDTDTCIFALKGKFPEIARRMQGYTPDHIKIPAIVKAELLLRAQRSNQTERVWRGVERFLDPFEIIPFDDSCANLYIQSRFALERRGLSIGPHGLLTAATVLARHGTLVTHNIREFQRIQGLALEDWTR